MEFPDELVGNGDHPWQDGNAVGSSNWMVGVHYGSDVGGAHASDWQIGAIMLLDTDGLFDNGPWLSKSVTYRVEVAVHNIDDSQYNYSQRVYASDADGGALLYSASDFPADAGGGTLATRGPWNWDNLAWSDGLNCGTNDFETAGNESWWNVGSPTFLYGYQGCFLVLDRTESISAGTWVGPYGAIDA